MNSHKFILLLIVCLSCGQAFAASVTPKKRTVELKEFTQIVVDIVPDLGVNIVFPFILDSDKHQPPYIQRLTNDNVFSVTKQEDIRRQNYTSVSVNRPEGGGQVFTQNTYIGNLFLSVDGYHISITLKTTTNLKKHFTDIILVPSDKDRKYLIEKEVAHIRKAQNEEHERRLQELDAKAMSMALSKVGSVLVEKPQKINIKEEIEGVISTKETMMMFFDKFYVYNNYTILVYEIQNGSSKDIVVNRTEVSSSDKERTNVQTVISASTCDRKIKSGETVFCAITTENNIIAKSDLLNISLLTNFGKVDASF